MISRLALTVTVTAACYCWSLFLEDHFAQAFAPPSTERRKRPVVSCARLRASSTEQMQQQDVYEYNGWKLTYRYQPAEAGFETASPLLLIHPVGIGLSNWFWKPLMAEWHGGSAVYAVNLIGCGIAQGGDEWDPDQRGLAFPLGWAQGCEALLQQEILPKLRAAVVASTKATDVSFRPSTAVACTVVAQGGLAPVGVLLAARNPETVDRLILTSPPSWNDMVTPVPDQEMDRNFNFLRSPVFGKLAFSFLENKWSIQFFSNVFLFADKCDKEWIMRALEEACPAARPPVQAFNSGFCNHRSFLQELATLVQPTLVLQGDADTTKMGKRHEYASEMRDCRIQTIAGLNVLPWESAPAVCRAIHEFLS